MVWCWFIGRIRLVFFLLEIGDLYLSTTRRIPWGVFAQGGFSCWTRLFIMLFEYCSHSHMHLSILTVIIYFPYCYKYGLARGEIGACIVAMVSLLGLHSCVCSVS